MTRTALLAVALLALSGCNSIRDLAPGHSANPYEKPPFYAKYLDTGSQLDAAIRERLDALREDPRSSVLHNELGALLVDKGFPKDAEREFERAINFDGKNHAAWYNLGLVRAARGDEFGARRALNQTLDVKPGHAAALFQLGLIEERRQHVDRAIELYAKAYRINPALLEVAVNPRILDSKLTAVALLRVYPTEHTRASMQLQDAPVLRQPVASSAPEAPSPQAAPHQIVPPSAPVTDPAMQQAAPSAEEDSSVRRPRRRRPRRVQPTPEETTPPPPVEEAPPVTEEAPVIFEQPPAEFDAEQNEPTEQNEEAPAVEIPEDEIPPPEEEEPPPPQER